MTYTLRKFLVLKDEMLTIQIYVQFKHAIGKSADPSGGLGTAAPRLVIILYGQLLKKVGAIVIA